MVTVTTTRRRTRERARERESKQGEDEEADEAERLERLSGFAVAAARRNRKSSVFGNDARSIYLEETKAPPMAIISRVYMHRYRALLGTLNSPSTNT